MIVHHHAQGSEAWHQARAGCITASKFSLLRESNRLKSGANKGDYKNEVKDYAFRLAVERISGQALDEGFETAFMRRGHELEPEARAAHEIEAGVIVEPAGFITCQYGVYGASADGFIAGEPIGCEYKCFLAPDKLRAILLGGDTSEVMDQVQGGMWLADAERWIFGLYCPALAAIGRSLTLIEIERDDAYITALRADLACFELTVCDYEFALRGPTAAPHIDEATQ